MHRILYIDARCAQPLPPPVVTSVSPGLKRRIAAIFHVRTKYRFAGDCKQKYDLGTCAAAHLRREGLHPNRDEPLASKFHRYFFFFSFYFSRTRKATNEATGRDALTRVHLNLKIEHGKIEVLHLSFRENHYGDWRVLYSCVFTISFRSLHGCRINISPYLALMQYHR
ncbi:hypothetical protein ALC56_13225 [Trachymyrmex septentrionalis]|uniref:Uncharacterized protein n=1 Tax=Trachymyrmex septentrionalis TaxID=34720 RepID=A0A195EVV3_9HYME|nr:hypothetical protein ALC56_13225 [Trachymyrmex septentrionalis]